MPQPGDGIYIVKVVNRPNGLESITAHATLEGAEAQPTTLATQWGVDVLEVQAEIIRMTVLP